MNGEEQETIADICQEMKKEALKFGKHWKEGRSVIATNLYANSIYSFADRIEAANWAHKCDKCALAPSGKCMRFLDLKNCCEMKGDKE